MVRVLALVLALVCGCVATDDAPVYGPVTELAAGYVEQPGMDLPGEPLPEPPIQDDDIVELAYEICAAETGCVAEACDDCAQRVAGMMFPLCLPL